jgi:hypothetical protein
VVGKKPKPVTVATSLVQDPVVLKKKRGRPPKPEVLSAADRARRYRARRKALSSS